MVGPLVPVSNTPSPTIFLGRVEYRYTDLGRASFVNLATNSAELGNRVTMNDVRVGIAYKF